jgi:hypothetical protein
VTVVSRTTGLTPGLLVGPIRAVTHLICFLCFCFVYLFACLFLFVRLYCFIFVLLLLFLVVYMSSFCVLRAQCYPYLCDVHCHIDNLWRVLNVVYYMNIYNEDIKLIYKIPCLFSTPPSPPPICDVFITRFIMLEAAMKNNFQFFCDMWLKAIIVHKITFFVL